MATPVVIGRTPQPTTGTGKLVHPAAPVWHVRLSERDGDASVVGYLGEAVPTPGFEGVPYENVVMPKWTPITVFRSTPHLTFSFEIIFSKFITEESVWDDVYTLYRMFRPVYVGVPPPVIKINSAGAKFGLTPFEPADWWISALEFGAAQANNDGERTLQRITVTLTEYWPDVKITRTTRHQWPAMVIVKKGWTLKTIAHKYKVPGGWRSIGKIQNPPITDPRKVKTGQHIRMP
jgi:hypothetical protein